jgi:hypothetical protein
MRKFATHIPGALNIGLISSFATWAGTVLPADPAHPRTRMTPSGRRGAEAASSEPIYLAHQRSPSAYRNSWYTFC